MKDWILNTFFRQTLADTFREASIDAFRKAHADLLETHQEEVEKRAGELAKERLEKLLTIVDPALIVTMDTRAGAILIGGERADPGRVANLHSEAQFFAESDLWKVIVESNKRLAEKAMFVDDGKMENQLLKGRAILYTLDTQNKILKLFKTLSPGQSSG
jgi:hypothetical protein